MLDDDLFQKDEHVSERVREQSVYYGNSNEDFESEKPIRKPAKINTLDRLTKGRGR